MNSHSSSSSTQTTHRRKAESRYRFATCAVLFVLFVYVCLFCRGKDKSKCVKADVKIVTGGVQQIHISPPQQLSARPPHSGCSDPSSSPQSDGSRKLPVAVLSDIVIYEKRIASGSSVASASVPTSASADPARFPGPGGAPVMLPVPELNDAVLGSLAFYSHANSKRQRVGGSGGTVSITDYVHDDPFFSGPAVAAQLVAPPFALMDPFTVPSPASPVYSTDTSPFALTDPFTVASPASPTSDVDPQALGPSEFGEPREQEDLNWNTLGYSLPMDEADDRPMPPAAASAFS